MTDLNGDISFSDLPHVKANSRDHVLIELTTLQRKEREGEGEGGGGGIKLGQYRWLLAICPLLLALLQKEI